MEPAIRAVAAFLLAAATAHAAPLLQGPSRIAPSPFEVHPVLAGQGIPSARLQAVDSRILSLKVEVRKKPTVLAFVGASSAPGTEEMLRSLRKLAPQLAGLGYQVLVISPELPEELRKLQTPDKSGFILLSDRERDAAEHFGLSYRPKASEQPERTVPAAFILDLSGTILFESVNPDPKTPLKAEVLLAAARAYAAKP